MRMYDDGGVVANTILQQLGGAGRLRAMTGAYNFIDLGNGLSFKIKNARANYIKIKLTSMDLYDVEVGRIRGNTYTVVKSGEGLYFDQLRPFIEKATGMYLSLRKGGEIEKSIKQKLSKSFELPLQMAIYVPSTKDKDINISKKEMDERVLDVKSYLAELFGGFNSAQVEGGFESSDKGLIEEDAVRVVAFATQDGFENKFQKLISKIKLWCKEWGQESIGLEFENDLFYIESGSEYSKGGMIEHQTDDGETLKYKIDENEMSVEVDFPTMEYLSENGIVMKKEARKLRETYIFWYDDINSSSKEELEDILKVELPLYQRGYDDDERDDYDDYARGGGINDKHRIYFSTLSEVIEAIHDIASENGYEVVEIFPDLSYGGISYGQTKKVKVDLKWNGKEKVGKSKRRETNTLNVSIYRMDSGNYELVSYFSYEKGGMMAKGGETKDVVYIKFRNAKKKFNVDTKYFRGDNAYQDAVKWGRKNLSNFNMDMVKHEMADGGMMANGGEIEIDAKFKTENANWTNEKLKNEYDLYVQMKKDFAEGLIKPSKVIGTGYKSSYVARRLAKEWIDKQLAIYERALQIRGVMAKGGKVKKRVRFVDKVESIADRLEGTKVPKRLKKDYGVRYNLEESQEAARRIAGAQLRDRKM